MNINIYPEVERNFKCAVIQEYGNLRGNLEREVNIALAFLIMCKEKGIALDKIQKVKEYVNQL